MSARRRRRLLVTTAAVVLGTAGLLATTTPSDRSRPSRPKDRPAKTDTLDQHPRPQTSTSDTRGDEPPNPPGGAEQRRAARRVARRFTVALLSLEQRPSRRAHRTLKLTATPALVRLLLAAAPRGQPPPDLTRVGQVRCYGPFEGQIKASIWLRTGHKPPWLLEVELARHGGGWRVARLRP